MDVLTFLPFGVMFAALEAKNLIETERMLIRPVRADDLVHLLCWWNDGEVMRHVGFPNGLGITMKELEASWEKWKNDPLGLMKIICLKDSTAIGETNFHDYQPDNKQTEIGIKICRPDLWGEGLGTEALAAMTRHAFEALGVDRVLLNPSKTNARIIHVNQKCGYRIIGGKERRAVDGVKEGGVVTSIITPPLTGGARGGWRLTPTCLFFEKASSPVKGEVILFTIQDHRRKEWRTVDGVEEGRLAEKNGLT